MGFDSGEKVLWRGPLLLAPLTTPQGLGAQLTGPCEADLYPIGPLGTGGLIWEAGQADRRGSLVGQHFTGQLKY